MAYYTYILRCSDGSLYTGITTDLPRRFAEHSRGTSHAGAKYTASRRPEAYECAFQSDDRAAASRLEARIKRLTRSQKLKLIAGESFEKLELDAYRRLKVSPIGEIYVNAE